MEVTGIANLCLQTSKRSLLRDCALSAHKKTAAWRAQRLLCKRDVGLLTEQCCL